MYKKRVINLHYRAKYKQNMLIARNDSNQTKVQKITARKYMHETTSKNVYPRITLLGMLQKSLSVVFQPCFFMFVMVCEIVQQNL